VESLPRTMMENALPLLRWDLASGKDSLYGW
jgi:hypothetical protein